MDSTLLPSSLMLLSVFLEGLLSLVINLDSIRNVLILFNFIGSVTDDFRVSRSRVCSPSLEHHIILLICQMIIYFAITRAKENRSLFFLKGIIIVIL